MEFSTHYLDLITTNISGASSITLLIRLASRPEYLSLKENTDPEIFNRLQNQPSFMEEVAQIPHGKVMDVPNTVRMVSPVASPTSRHKKNKTPRLTNAIIQSTVMTG